MLWLQNAKARPAGTHPPEITTISNLHWSEHPSLSDRNAGNDATVWPVYMHTCLATQNKTTLHMFKRNADRTEEQISHCCEVIDEGRWHIDPPPFACLRSHPAQRMYVQVYVHKSISSSSSQKPAPQFTMRFWAKPSSLITDGVCSLEAQVTRSFSHAPFSCFPCFPKSGSVWRDSNATTCAWACYVKNMYEKMR